MAMVDMVYEYLTENYQENEPIFLVEISIPGVKEGTVRQQMKKLTEDGRIKRLLRRTTIDAYSESREVAIHCI